MGADYDMESTPGLEAGGFEFYTVAGAERLRDALADFDGGRVLVSVLGQPFKCPPAPFEGAFLMHEYFTQRGIRESVQMTSTFPMQRPVPVTGEVAQMFRDALAARDIEERPQHLVTSIDPATRTAQLADGGTLSYDLFVGIPIHRAPDPLAASGLAVDGWVPVDQTNLRTRFPQVYASATSAPAPAPSRRPASSPSRPRASSPTTSRPRSSAPSHPRPMADRASVMPSSVTGSSAKSRSTFSAGQRQPPSHTNHRANSSPRRRSSARPGGRAGSGSDFALV